MMSWPFLAQTSSARLCDGHFPRFWRHGRESTVGHKRAKKSVAQKPKETLILRPPLATFTVATLGTLLQNLTNQVIQNHPACFQLCFHPCAAHRNTSSSATACYKWQQLAGVCSHKITCRNIAQALPILDTSKITQL